MLNVWVNTNAHYLYRMIIELKVRIKFRKTMAYKLDWNKWC